MNILDKVRHKDTTYLTNNIKDNQPAETLGEALKKDEEDIDNLQTTTQTSTVNKKVVIGLFLFFMTVVQQPYFNTFPLDGTVPDDLIHEMIDHSYAAVVKKLPKYLQKKLGCL